MFLIPSREPLSPVDWVSDECKEYWNDALQHLGTDFEEHLRCFLSEFGSILSSSTGFRVRVVVDTNVALSETLRLMRGKGPFLSKLTKSPFLEVVAPIEMEHELLEKIGEKFQDSDDRDKAIEIAQSVLNNVSVVAGFRIDSMVRAQALLGVRDPDDVVFIQIAIDYNTHGVISKDQHFMNLGEIKRWELGEVGRVITEMNRGALTLWVAARGLPIAALVLIKFGMMIVSLGFRAIQQLVSTGVNLVGTAIGTVIAAARAHPLLALGAVVGIALVSVFLMSWEPSRPKLDAIAESGMDAINDLISGTAMVVDGIVGAIQALVEVSKDQIPSLIEWLGCLSSSTLLLLRRVEELEQVKV